MTKETLLQRDKSQLKEKARHGDVFFPFQYYSTTLIPVYPEVPIHWHPEMELTMITEGNADYSIDFQDYHVSEGDFICIQPNLLHSARVTPKGSLKSDSFVFHLNLLGHASADLCVLQYFSPLLEGTLKLPHIISKDNPLYPELKKHFSLLTDCCNSQTPGYELEIKALLFHLLFIIITSPDTYHSESGDFHSERMKRVFNYLHSHYTEDISIETVSEICHITPSHFMHYFKEKSGTTFNQYLNQYRLNQSALLLTQGVPVAEAAFACGFNNLPYFYKRFREYYHMTPREFQSRQNNE